MHQQFWQAKIWGLLHDPALKALHHDMSREGGWENLQCMEGWKSPKEPNTHSQTDLNGTWLKYIGLCDLISSASDRSTVGRLPAEHSKISYDREGLELRHLLSGKKQTLKLEQWHDHINQSDRTSFLEQVEAATLDIIRTWDNPEKVYWWLWRCYIPALATALGETEEPCIHLLPAETRLPDASLWSHVTMTSALAGALAGYYNSEDYPKKNKSFKRSRPHIATFSFTPVQELIKASRKMRDFWAGSWLLHYLSAKICWAIAQKYGPDSILYPCLYTQPLIDHWLLQKYPDFHDWIKLPKAEIWEQKLLTAGFPNVIVMILPDNGESPDTAIGNPVRAAMKFAKNTLKEEWRKLSNHVLDWLQKDPTPGGEAWRQINPHTWEGWLKEQWQHYWVALPIGNSKIDLHQSPRQRPEYDNWISEQNDFASAKPGLFPEAEYQFLEAVFRLTAPADCTETGKETREEWKAKQPNLNVGSWWPSIFDSLRFSLKAVKSPRTWKLPTAFSPRSTISGIGSVVHPIFNQENLDWATEAETREFWNHDMNIFDGIEQLNATEVIKRGLHQILLKELFPDAQNRNAKIPVLYPDLSSGVAGWLRKMETENNPKGQKAIDHFTTSCQDIINEFPWVNQGQDAPAKLPWGIPWIAKKHTDWCNPRLLNAGWLIDDYHPTNPNANVAFTRQEQQEEKRKELQALSNAIAKCFPPGKNPTDWYVLAVGDGDSMSEWLKGTKLETYSHYLPKKLHSKIEKMPDKYRQPLATFLQQKKRMGPSTHSALSRALLDFSNQLVPHLTEERYAGRLIYSGGDDVLAYTNLWEWDKWLWDIRQCFRGDEDPLGDLDEQNREFDHKGDYWQWKDEKKLPDNLSKRPLFTMGSKATISFGIVIAHHSVPLAIALENLWEAEEKAKEHEYHNSCRLKDRKDCYSKKDAVQVRVLYGNGNILKSTSKFNVFHQWQQLLSAIDNLDAALFEQAASVWSQHPAPLYEAIQPWSLAFCARREQLKNDSDNKFQQHLAEFLKALWQTTPNKALTDEIYNWLKLAAFVIRKRQISIPGE